MFLYHTISSLGQLSNFKICVWEFSADSFPILMMIVLKNKIANGFCKAIKHAKILDVRNSTPHTYTFLTLDIKTAQCLPLIQ